MAMHAKRFASLLVFLAATTTTPAFGQTSTTICAITRNPSAFDDKLVRIRAMFVHGFEVSTIRDPEVNCFDVIWLDYGPGPQPEEFVALELSSKGSVAATVTGRIRYAGTGIGFGHMGAYRIRLELQSISDPVAVAGTIAGQVNGPDGQPVEGAEVVTESRSFGFSSDSMFSPFGEWMRFPSCTDEKGQFTIAIEPGNYVLTVNPIGSATPLVPFPPTFVPGIMLIKDKERREVSVKLGKPYTLRKIPVKVVWSNGSPAVDVEVAIGEGSDPDAVDSWRNEGRTNQSGVVNLLGFGERDQLVLAYIRKPRNKDYCASAAISSTSDPQQPTRLRLTKSRWCRQGVLRVTMGLIHPCWFKDKP